jgi:hypothetical protein
MRVSDPVSIPSEEVAMRHHSAALSLDQTIQELEDAQTLLRVCVPIIQDLCRSSPGNSVLVACAESLVRQISRSLPAVTEPPATLSRWCFRRSLLYATVLGCVEDLDGETVVAYRYDAEVSNVAISTMPLRSFLEEAVEEKI